MNELNFDDSLIRWLKQAQDIVNSAWMARNYTHAAPPLLTLERGKKNIKVFRADNNGLGSRSVHCFIDIATGDVLKAASCKAPAKGKRGSIYELDSPGVNEYGGIYKR